MQVSEKRGVARLPAPAKCKSFNEFFTLPHLPDATLNENDRETLRSGLLTLDRFHKRHAVLLKTAWLHTES